ncbi:MAG: Hsp20 family protein [Acidobacteria bacterium]|nr:Hsp20 family protein [Acidobacteriota bacterium]
MARNADVPTTRRAPERSETRRWDPYRVVPLPPGAIADSAKAKFSNGVLEVTVQAPSQETRRGRKIDISGT